MMMMMKLSKCAFIAWNAAFFDVATSIQGMLLGNHIHICQEFQDAQIVVESTKHEEIEVNAKQAVFFFFEGGSQKLERVTQIVDCSVGKQ